MKNDDADGYRHIKWIKLMVNETITSNGDGESSMLASQGLRENEEIDTSLNAAKTTLSQLDFLIFISDVLSSA